MGAIRPIAIDRICVVLFFRGERLGAESFVIKGNLSVLCATGLRVFCNGVVYSMLLYIYIVWS